MKLVEVLRTARVHIVDPSTWTYGALARTCVGGECDPLDDSAVRWCLEGAIHSAAKGDEDLAWEAFDYIEPYCPMAIPLTNDLMGHKITLRSIDRAIASLEVS